MKNRIILLLAVLLLAACGKRQDAPGAPSTQSPAPAPTRSSQAATNPFAAATPVAGADTRFVGRIVQRLNAGSYVYLEVDKPGSGPTWVVTAEALAPDADRVIVHVIKRVEHFESRRLRRSFAPLGFAVVRKDES